MKLDMSAKSGEGEPTSPGDYSEEDLEDMLENYLQAKKIEADPAIFTAVKEYAISRNKMVDELFNQPAKPVKAKSLADLKSKYKEMTDPDKAKEKTEAE